MLISTLVMAALAIVVLYIGYARGGGEHLLGLKNSSKMILQVVPLLIFACIIASMVQLLIPHEQITKWVGAESGFRGILIGTVAGGLAPGGPYYNLPIAVSLIQAGASVGTTVAFISAWALWAFERLPLEVGILGWKLMLIRFVSSFIFPPIIGWIAQFFFGNIKIQ